MKHIFLAFLLSFVCAGLALDCGDGSTLRYCNEDNSGYFTCLDNPNSPDLKVEQPVAAGTKCAQNFTDIYMVLDETASDCVLGKLSCVDGEPTKFSICSPSGLETLNTPNGTNCATEGDSITFVFAGSELCSPIGAQECTEDKSEFTVCSPSGKVTFQVPSGAQCSQYNETAVEFTSMGSSCGEFGTQTCVGDTAFTVCSPLGLVQMAVPFGTKCSQFNDTAIELVEIDGGSSCGEIGAQICWGEKHYNVCTTSGFVTMKVPDGAVCGQKDDEVEFSFDPADINSNCGGIGKQTCVEDQASYLECTVFGEIPRNIPIGTKCIQLNETHIDLENILAEVVEEQASQIASLQSQISKITSGTGSLVPSLLFLLACFCSFF